jgi:CubicO group peptidase (beta-lactamase class C family)
LITQPEVGTSPYWPTDGWRASTPEEQGMDSEILVEMLDELIEQSYNIDSISVVRNGYLVLDVAVAPYRSSNKHVIHSCTKSIVSALIGIALEQGHLKSVDQPLLEIFADRQVANLDGRKQSITLENVLTMSSGWRCRDSYLYRWRGIEEMLASDDWVQHMLDLPMEGTPGTIFEYCNGGSFLLSAILQETTGMTALAYAEDNLFEPLGISKVDWPSNPQGISIGWGDLRMLPHDMAKFGYLYLNEGQWDGEQIVPAEWVRASWEEHISATLQPAYGYQWWIDPPSIYMALGYAGQFIFVVPEHDLVVVFTSDLPDQDFYSPQILLKDYIIPAAQSSVALDPNKEALVNLQSRVDELAAP